MGRARALGDAAVGVELDLEVADDLGVLPGLDHADGAAVHVGQARGVGAAGRAHAGGVEHVGAEQGVRVAAHDHVHAAELGHDLAVVLIAHVAHDDDLVDALGAQRVDFALGCRGLVLEGGVGIGAGRCLGFARNGQADDADLLAAALHHGGGVHIAGRLGRVQGRVGAKAHVGAEHGRLAGAGAQAVQEGLEAAVALVELVVAQREGVKADGVHECGIGLAVGACAVEVQRAGERVAGMQLEHVGRLRGQLLDGLGHARKACGVHGHGFGLARAGVQLQGLALGLQRGVVVVDVQNAQLQRLACGRVVAGAAATGDQGGGSQGHGQRAQGGAMGGQGHERVLSVSVCHGRRCWARQMTWR
ncbi:MAG: hypothetical protein GAK34_00691 [Delftia tsuruhatensis]|nr:MAG: hypothetical protein GAK34_00691 [Delftia tsuruhatensis]